MLAPGTEQGATDHPQSPGFPPPRERRGICRLRGAFFGPPLNEFYFPQPGMIGRVEKVFAKNKFLVIAIVIDIR